MVSARVLSAWLRETVRPPLAPGHPIAWGVLTEGTLLAGSDWPGWRSTRERVTEEAR